MLRHTPAKAIYAFTNGALVPRNTRNADVFADALDKSGVTSTEGKAVYGAYISLLSNLEERIDFPADDTEELKEQCKAYQQQIEKLKAENEKQKQELYQVQKALADAGVQSEKQANVQAAEKQELNDLRELVFALTNDADSDREEARTSLQYELKNKVAEFCKWYEEEEPFASTQGNPTNVVQDGVHKVYKITVTHDDGKKVIRTGTFDKNDLPSDWAGFSGYLKDFISAESFGELFNARAYNKVLRSDDEVTFCGVEIDGVVKTHYYHCVDEVCVGDFVEVPTPMKNKTMIGKVVELRHYTKEQIPNELEKTKDIIRLV